MGRPKEISDKQILVAARRCFLKQGASVTAHEIGKQLGVSHTTIFNRFGSKEGLMIAALGPPEGVPWAALLEDGPTENPILEQLIQHAKTIAAYFHDIHAGLTILQSSGISMERVFPAKEHESRPLRAYYTLTRWLETAQKQKRIAPCDIPTLARTILSALHGWAMTAQFCGMPASKRESELHIERFMELLWQGIAPTQQKNRD